MLRITHPEACKRSTLSEGIVLPLRASLSELELFAKLREEKSQATIPILSLSI